MGICKCRKRTDLYCYLHSKAVCSDCVVDCDENLAHIGSYVEWLQDPNPPPPLCALSKTPLDATVETIRLTDFKIYSLQAVDGYVASLGAEKAQQAILPSGMPIVPPPTVHSRLAQRIRLSLSERFAWAVQAPLPPEPEKPATTPSMAAVESSQVRRQQSADAVTAINVPADAVAPDDEATKYARRPLPAPRCSGGVNRQRVVLLLAIIGTLMVVILLALQLDLQESEVVHTGSGRGQV